MKTIKTAEAEGQVLDWLVLMCEGCPTLGEPKGVSMAFEFSVMHPDDPDLRYSIEWPQGGPIIEREGISLLRCFGDWRAEKENYDHDTEWVGQGPTPLIAAMRCFVISKLGETVEVPEELT